MEIELNPADIARLLEQKRADGCYTEKYPNIEESSHYDTGVFFKIYTGLNDKREFSVRTGKLKDVLKSTLQAGINLGIAIGKEEARNEIKKTLGLPTNFEIENKS